MYLLPFRFELNARARRRRRESAVRYLYSPDPYEAAHLEVALMEDMHRWEREAAAVLTWARAHGLPLRGTEEVGLRNCCLATPNRSD